MTSILTWFKLPPEEGVFCLLAGYYTTSTVTIINVSALQEYHVLRACTASCLAYGNPHVFAAAFLTWRPSVYGRLRLSRESVSVHFNKWLVIFFFSYNYYAILFPLPPYANRYDNGYCFYICRIPQFGHLLPVKGRGSSTVCGKKKYPWPDSNWRYTA